MALHQDLTAFGIENRSYSIEEWQALELRTGEKFEYHQGRLLSVRMMAGGSPQHSIIGANVLYLLGVGVRMQKLSLEQIMHCNVHTSDLQIFIPAQNRYVYADAALVCGSPERELRVKTAIINPILVVDVLSPSSVGYDTGVKFEYYSSLDSLRDYVLVTQDDHMVEVRSRTEAGGPWTFAFAKTSDATVELPSIGVTLPLVEVYRGVNFEENGDGEGVAV